MAQTSTATTPVALTSAASSGVPLIPGVNPTTASDNVMPDGSLTGLITGVTLGVLILVLLCIIIAGMVWYSRNQKGSYVTNETKDGKDNEEDKEEQGEEDEEEVQSREPLKIMEDEEA